MTREERSAIGNAIWLCHSCAIAVDADPQWYPVEVLQQWKADAEQRARDAVETSHRFRPHCSHLLLMCERAADANRKGQILEDLIESLLSSAEGLALDRKRRLTGDEEVDLVFINNIDQPFWISLNSPLFFVECKNTNKPIGASELRNFEGKLQNHAKLAKVGFFVSLSGFTSEVTNALKRMGRDEFLIVLIERDDIVECLTTEISVLDWLGDLVRKFH